MKGEGCLNGISELKEESEMAWSNLPTDYTDAVWDGMRKYNLITNEDGTVSLQDVTTYINRENSFFGANDANQMNTALNSLMNMHIENVLYKGAGAHNAVYRGKYLGATVTSDQYLSISNGDFKDLYIGDYWTINNVTYRIAAFDYYYQTGDTPCTTHHVTIVPDLNMYSYQMNDTDITTGAYVGSKMYSNGLTEAKNIIKEAFGTSHILNHRQSLQNAVTNNYASGNSWYSSTVELMTEQNVYGCKIFGNTANGTAIADNYTVDKSQYPLFVFRPDLISNRQWFWLRDVVSANRFAHVSVYGSAYSGLASDNLGVRPAFSIV